MNSDVKAAYMAEIPDSYLTGRRRKRLGDFCRERGYLPTLLEVEAERRRRAAEKKKGKTDE